MAKSIVKVRFTRVFEGVQRPDLLHDLTRGLLKFVYPDVFNGQHSDDLREWEDNHFGTIKDAVTRGLKNIIENQDSEEYLSLIDYWDCECNLTELPANCVEQMFQDKYFFGGLKAVFEPAWKNEYFATMREEIEKLNLDR